jgi:hypothetical protein
MHEGVHELRSGQANRPVLSFECSKVGTESVVQGVCQRIQPGLPRSESRAANRMATSFSSPTVGQTKTRYRSEYLRGSDRTRWRAMRGVWPGRTNHEYEWALVHAGARSRSPDRSSPWHVVSPMQYRVGLCPRRPGPSSQTGRLFGESSRSSVTIARSRRAKGGAAQPRYIWADQTSAERLEANGRRTDQDHCGSDRTQVSIQRRPSQRGGPGQDRRGPQRSEAFRGSSSQYASRTTALSRTAESSRTVNWMESP